MFLVQASRELDVVFDRSDRRDPRAQRVQKSGLLKQTRDGPRESDGVARAKQQTILSIRHNLRNPADPGGDHGKTGTERFQDHQRTVLRPDRRHDEDVDGRQRAGNPLVLDRAVEPNARLPEKRLELLPIAVVAVIGHVPAIQIDRHRTGRKMADGLEQEMRRFRCHQAAEKAEPQWSA